MVLLEEVKKKISEEDIGSLLLILHFYKNAFINRKFY